MQLKQQPYNLLLLIATLLFIVGLFGFNSAIDIQMHDTYFVIQLTYFVWIPAIILLAFWLLYLMTKAYLYSKALIWTHLIFTIIGCFFILILPYLLTNSYEGLAGMPRRYYDIEQSKTYRFFGNLTTTTIVFSYILIIGQLTFILNLMIGILSRVSKKNNR